MSLALDPFVQNKLEEFVSRRRRWTLIHGVLIGLAIWLVGILAFTWADAIWIMDRPVRLILSLLVYVAAAIAVTMWIRYRSSGRDPVQKAAIEIERGDPRFRDQLLSTVELVRGDYDTRSRSFIAASQHAISQKMRAFDVRTLLPWRLLAKPFAIAMGIFMLCCLLVLFPKLEYTSRFARAIIPGFDIDRVSRTRITIERPQPASSVVPANETTAIVVSLYGQSADRAVLQWYDADGKGGKVEMQPADNSSASETASVGSFAANLSVAQSLIKYRIKAGDGVTGWYSLEPKGRPEIVQLDAVISPPGYSELPDEELKNSDGNLKGLVGSTARVSIQFNMPVREATLRRLNLDSRQPMMQQGDAWTADIAINEDDRYQILAVAAETGFDNPLSPQYRIQAVMDEVPLVRWADTSIAPVAASSQKRKRELVTHFSSLKMSVSVSDEMPVRRLRQEIRINGGDWTSTQLSDMIEEPSLVHRWDWNLDAIKHDDKKLAAGDVLETRIVATDRKGGRGESEIKEFIISDHQFDNSKKERLQTWIELAQSVHAWRASVAQQLVELKVEEKLPDLGEKLNAAPPAPITAEEFQKLEAALDARVVAMMDKAAADHESAKLEQLARAMFVTRTGLDEVAKVPEDKRREYRWINQISDTVDKSSRVEVGHHLAIVVVDSLQRMQASIYPTVRQHDPVDWQNFAKYLEVAKEQYLELAQTIASVSPDTLDSTRRHYEGRVRFIEDRMRELNEVESKAGDQGYLRNRVETVHREVKEGQYGGSIDGSVHDHQNDVMKRFQNEIGWTKSTVEKIVRLFDEQKNWTEKAKSSNTEEARSASEQIDARKAKQDFFRDRLLAQLAHDGELHQHQKHPDQRYIADAHLMRRVIETIGESTYTPAENKTLRDIYQEVANAYQWLEAGHDIKQWLTELQTLAEQDRWSADTALGRVDAPHQIARITLGLESPTNAVQNAGLPWPEVEPIARLRWDQSNVVRESINARRWGNQTPISGADKLDDVHAAGIKAIEPLEVKMEEARQLLNSFLPSIAELAARTAESLRETKVDEKKPEVTEKVEQAREDVERKAETLKEQLIDEANTQEMLTDEGRRKARNADISLQAIEKRMEEVTAAQEQLAAAPESQKEQAAEELNQAADAAAKTMDQIAQHYEQEASDDANQELASEKSPLLEQIEKDLDLKSKLDQEYARLNALANALDSDPRELLKKLQQELARNPLMQRELDAIADQTLLEAQKALEQQAERERSMQLQLEQSDPRIAAAKRDIEQAIRDAGREAYELQRSLMDAANRASERPDSVPEAMKEKNKNAQEQLREASRAVEQAVNQAEQVRPAHDERLANLAEKAEQVASAIEQAKQKLEQAKQPLSEMLNEGSAQLSDKRREELKRDMENVQSTARNSQAQLARETAQRKNSAAQQRENELKSAKQNLNRERENLKRTEDRLNKEPDNQGLKQERQRMAEQVAKLETTEQVAQSSADKAKQAADAAKARAESIAHETLPKLDRPLPTVELAERMQSRSEEGLKQIAEQLKQLSNQAKSLQAAQPERQRLAEAAQNQPRVEADVAEVAEDMARAARHQQRLGENELAKITADAAAAVKQLAEGQVHETTEALERAQTAATAEQPSAETMQNEAQNSYRELGESESALRQQAEALAAANAALDAKSAAERAAAESAAAAQAAAQESARQKARTLDDLDRALAEAQRPNPEGQQSDSGQPGQQSASQQSKKSSTLASEARKQAQQMAKQRSKSGQEPSEQQSEGEPSEDATESGEGESKQMADFYEIEELDREGNGDWAKLREREIDDVTEAERPEISPEYRRQIEAYFRAVAERSKSQ